LVNAGGAGNAAPGTVGPTLWTSTPQVPWFYGLAACNLRGQTGWPNSGSDVYVTLLWLTHDSGGIGTTDETL
jgi:hypothetical protein